MHILLPVFTLAAVALAIWGFTVHARSRKKITAAPMPPRHSLERVVSHVSVEDIQAAIARGELTLAELTARERELLADAEAPDAIGDPADRDRALRQIALNKERVGKDTTRLTTALVAARAGSSSPAPKEPSLVS